MDTKADVAKKLRDLIKNIFKSTPLALVKTYGCQQNVSDGEKYKSQLEEIGFEITDDISRADFILFNTCAIREHAQEKVFGNIGALKHLKKQNKNLKIAVCGCMTEQAHVTQKIKNSYPFVDLVFGTKSMGEFLELLYKCYANDKRLFYKSTSEYADLAEDIKPRRDGKFKAWLPIMYGCNNFCSYCIVPYVRGREISRNTQDIINEAKDIIKAGYKDITLLGQNVNSYGKGRDDCCTFAQLLQEISDIDGDFTLRFMTSHPKDATKEMIDTIAKNKKISRHLHLPVQSGSDRILKLMNRVYDRKRYLEIINYAKSKIEDVEFTSDIIVGFPGETYEDFKETLSLIKQVKFASLFTFIYSPRKGTKAALMDDPIKRSEKQKWFDELLSVQEEISAQNCKEKVGKTIRVLVEGKGKNKGELYARTSGNIIVEFLGDENLIGNFVNVEITDSLNWVLKAKYLK